MRLGKYELGTPVFLAPMAGVTDKAFRQTVRSVGGTLTWTEMISDMALNYQNPRTLHMLNLSGEAEPCIVQIFGSKPASMAAAAEKAVGLGADVIDINMGCPTPKIVKNGEGSALLRNLTLAQEIAAAVVDKVQVPVTAKFRIGWNAEEKPAVELAQRLEAVGVRMVVLHARTREQYYSGQADWQWIAKVKNAVTIPVIGNGDVRCPQDARDLLEQTGCDGVMIGRAALGNPWVIPFTQHFLLTGRLLPDPPQAEKLRVALAHFERLVAFKGERIGLNEMRKHAVWYIKGIRNAAQWRDQIMQSKDVQDMYQVFAEIFALLA